MTSVGGDEESPDWFSLASVGRRVAAARRRGTGWLWVRVARLRDAVGRAREDRGLDPLDDGRCRATAGRVLAAARPALAGCRQLVGRRLAEACGGGGRQGTARRLRESLGFWRAVLAEFVGTFFLVVIGCGSATEQMPYSPAHQLRQDRAVRMAFAFGT